MRREKDRKELDDLLRDSSEGEIDLQKYREQRSKMRRAEAARSRYQRMSEAERKVYNQRRRLRALGLDPDMPKGSFIDNEAIREHIKMANAKKAEAARLRYHRMTVEEKREYNQRRTESFRKRRLEEEILLSTPAGRISAEALQKVRLVRLSCTLQCEVLLLSIQISFKAQQIMIRNARKAEAARARYQKMSPEQRKMSHTTDDIFEQMEREVIKRTKQAHMALARQQQQSQANRFPSTVDQHLIDGDTVLITNDGHIVDDKCFVQPSQLIDEKALHDMLLTGLDANGQPVELRTVDGTLIRGEEQLRAITNGQPFLIHPQPLPISNVEEQGKTLTFANAQDQVSQHAAGTATTAECETCRNVAKGSFFYSRQLPIEFVLNGAGK
ncbi:hypothetical protein ANCCEY_13447 [Ancylostoma ceylanicum]|uniref:Uncharacterized protein n=1 Tax=Ancylostoma ceylanicum TaxID=53326 RepID=A0A0D6LCA4_9BILA|nr:hypothetical protein ANCCEY_13447 [Ancylostoma ceylanicum]